ncbi:MAG: MerR family transcriptional regulator [Hyphomicrobiales bacterium]|nr:MAG: MerR family transcriptional regulator [Hyphomicrobiales bacterium]
MEKSPDAFRTISEAAEELDLPQHVLRFWETRFSTIKPLKRGGGRRYYRPEDVLLLKGIRHLLYDQGFTIKGVQRILKDQGIRYVVGIGEGRVMEPLSSSPAEDEPAFAAAPASRIAHESDAAFDEPDMPRALSAGGRALSEKDREKLADVLRELLDCKRILERAREG